MFPPNIWGCKFTDNSSIYKASSKQICQIYEWHTLTTQKSLVSKRINPTKDCLSFQFIFDIFHLNIPIKSR